MESTLEKLNKIAEKVGAEIIEHKPYSTHPDDSHLEVVLCRLGRYKYVTWIANLTEGLAGFAHGRYFERFIIDDEINYHDSIKISQELYRRALKDYNTRGVQY